MPERIGRYRIEREIGRGGMGVVYAGYDSSLERMVAIKTIASGHADEYQRKRFLREARAAARIRHPNVCHLYEISDDESELFIAMELLEGESLAARIDRGPLDVPEAIAILEAILAALSELHAHEMVHRDLKPSNVFLTPHGVKLLDFGLAREIFRETAESEADTVSRLTRDGGVVGTLSYMAPEQLRAQVVDGRTDLFALGAVLFEMLTAKRAFPGQTATDINHRTLHEQPPALSGSEAVRALDKVIRRALSKRPEDRFASAHAMADALGAAKTARDSGEETRAHTITRLIVVPFRQLRPDGETEFLSFAVPDAVTTALTGLEGIVVRSSAVAARFTGDDLDLKRIGEEADVDVVLTGTLLRLGDRVRANVQLLEVPDGTVLWSHSPQVAIRDLFELQDQIVKRVVESLTLSLTGREEQRLKADVPATPSAYEYFLRANHLLAPQGMGSLPDQKVAQDLYLRTVEEDPRYAPAWARLGRCHWLIGKGGEDRKYNVDRAEECFARALELSPQLPLAHNLYALLEIDLGRAREAMVRLVTRGLSGGTQPELFAALVQACRYSGLPEASIAAHERALALDRYIVTSAYQTHFHIGDYESALAAMRKQKPYLIDLAILVERGQTVESLRLIEERLAKNIPEMVRQGLFAQRGVIEGNRDAVVTASSWWFDNVADPEACFHMARYLAAVGDQHLALESLERSLEGGYIHYHALVRKDPSLDLVRSTDVFEHLVELSKEQCRKSVAAFVAAGGEQLLGTGSLPRLDQENV